jgi:hypothetical protein
MWSTNNGKAVTVDYPVNQNIKGSFILKTDKRYQAAVLTAQHVAKLNNGESKLAKSVLKTLDSFAGKMSSDKSVDLNLINVWYLKAYQYNLL